MMGTGTRTAQPSTQHTEGKAGQSRGRKCARSCRGLREATCPPSLVLRALRGHQASPPRGTAVRMWVPGQGHSPGHPLGGLLAHLDPPGESFPPGKGHRGCAPSPQLCPPQGSAWWHQELGHTARAGTGDTAPLGPGTPCSPSAMDSVARPGTARHGTARITTSPPQGSEDHWDEPSVPPPTTSPGWGPRGWR